MHPINLCEMRCLTTKYNQSHFQHFNVAVFAIDLISRQMEWQYSNTVAGRTGLLNFRTEYWEYLYIIIMPPITHIKSRCGTMGFWVISFTTLQLVGVIVFTVDLSGQYAHSHGLCEATELPRRTQRCLYISYTASHHDARNLL